MTISTSSKNLFNQEGFWAKFTEWHTLFKPVVCVRLSKRSSKIEVSAQDAQVLCKVAAELACSEGLQAYARAAELRFR